MYKKFLSITLLVSIAHAIFANDLQMPQPAIAEIAETAIPANLEIKQEVAVAAISVEVQEQVAIAPEVIAENVEVSSDVEAVETAVEVIESIEPQDKAIEEVSPVTIEPTIIDVSYDFVVAPKAAELLNGLSAEAQGDFNDFGVVLGKDLLVLQEVQDFINKHATIAAEYIAFKGESPKISVEFVLLGEEAMQKIQSKIDETNAKFAAVLSEENKLKFAEVQQDLAPFLNNLLGFALSQISTRKFATELIDLDTNQELMINVRVD